MWWKWDREDFPVRLDMSFSFRFLYIDVTTHLHFACEMGLVFYWDIFAIIGR